MNNSPQRYTITAALPYTNGPIHIGHLAGVYVPADIYARFLRMQGNDCNGLVLIRELSSMLCMQSSADAMYCKPGIRTF